MRKRDFGKKPTTLAVFCLGFALVLAGCDGTGSPAGNSGGLPTATSVTVSITGIPSQYQGSWGELELMVPATGNRIGRTSISAVGSTATFTLTAVPRTYHVFFSFGGRSRVAPSVAIIGGTNTIPWSDFAPPLSITVTGIPVDYHGSWGGIELIFPATGNRVGWASASISGTTTFTVVGVSGLHEVRLEFGGGDAARIYRTRTITYLLAEPNTIPWTAFEFMPPLTITITDIPSQYQGSPLHLGLMIPGTMNDVAWYWEDVTGSSMTFTFRGVGSGLYDVILLFWERMFAEEIIGAYSVSARNITTNTSIPFSQFTVLPPSITITITEIPVVYQNGFAELGLYHPETGSWPDWGFAEISTSGSSAIIRFWFVQSGIYDVHLHILGLERWAYRTAPARHISANTTIPWSAFTILHEGGAVTPITITGIPSRYHGGLGSIILYTPGTQDWAADEGAFIEGPSATFLVWGADPGTYDVELRLNGETVRYVLPSPRAIYAGMSIPFSQFVLSPQSHQQAFSVPLDRSERALPDGVGARLSLRARR